MKKNLLFFICFFFFVTPLAYAGMTGVNQATQQLCSIIQLFNGRIMRGMMLFAMFGLLMTFILGQISWDKIMVLVVGIGLVGNAGTIALLILPSTVTGISGTLNDGTVFNPTKKYTPEELLTKVCPSAINAGPSPSSQYTGK